MQRSGFGLVWCGGYFTALCYEHKGMIICSIVRNPKKIGDADASHKQGTLRLERWMSWK